MISPPAEKTFRPAPARTAVADLDRVTRALVDAGYPGVVVDLSAEGGLARAMAGLALPIRIWARVAAPARRKSGAAGRITRLPSDIGLAARGFAPGGIDVLHLGWVASVGDLDALLANWVPRLSPSGRVVVAEAGNAEPALRDRILSLPCSPTDGGGLPGWIVLTPQKHLPPAQEPGSRDAAEALWPHLAPWIEEVIKVRMAAMEHRIETRLLASLGPKLPQLYGEIEPLVQRAVKHKNDVQDDAIIGIGAKVDAHEAAIQDLVHHVQRMLRHPILR